MPFIPGSSILGAIKLHQQEIESTCNHMTTDTFQYACPTLAIQQEKTGILTDTVIHLEIDAHPRD